VCLEACVVRGASTAEHSSEREDSKNINAKKRRNFQTKKTQSHQEEERSAEWMNARDQNEVKVALFAERKITHWRRVLPVCLIYCFWLPITHTLR
jgi:hypothetical protein